MEFTVETAGPCRKRVKVTVPQERVTEEFDKSLRNWIRSVPVPGFRQGKTPRSLIEKRFGPQVAQDVKQALLDNALQLAFKQEDLEPISDPEIDIEAIEVDPAAELAFEFIVTVKPEFELPDLKSIEVSVPSAEPDEEEIERAMLDLRKSKATLRPVENAAVENGDVVTLQIRGQANDEEVLSDDNLPYEVGSNYLGGLITNDLDGQIEGKKVGDSVEGTAFAPPYATNHPLAGSDLSIQAEIVDHKRPDLPEVGDEFAKGFDFDSVAELKEAVSRDVGAQKERDRNRLIENLALQQLVEQTDFELPDEMIEREVDELAARTAYEMQQQNKSEEEVAQRMAEVKSQRAEESTRELKAFFQLDKIVEKERLLVTETEVKEAVGMIGAQSGKTPEQMYELLRESGRLASLRNQLREKKARERLRKKVKVSEVKAEDSGKAEAKKPAKKAAAKKKTTKKAKKDE